MARPSDFTQDIADQICEAIATGQSLRKVCEGEGFPSKTTVFRWLGTNTAFRDQYARAHEEQADYNIEEIKRIAMDDSKDFGFKAVKNEDGESAEVFINKDNIGRAKLQVDTLKWIASKLNPKKYGEFQRTELTGKDGGAIVLSIADQIRKAHEG